MARHFHSPLSPDQVWYRLNVLLRDHAVWGPERYHVQGELTDWGCRLWIGGMRVPLRLWTEEDPAGSAVCCRFAPHRRTLLEMLALLALPLGATVLDGRGESLRVVLLRLTATAAVLGAILALLLILVPWLFTWRKNAALLVWVRAHLLPWEPDGVALPLPEAQRACWTGVEVQTIPQLAYTFHSDLSPEDLPAALETWIAGRNALEEGRARTRAKWSGPRLALSRTEIEQIDGVRRGGGSIAYAVGKEWTFRQPFRGTVEPDGAGGSLLRGGFGPAATEGILAFLRDHFDEVAS